MLYFTNRKWDDLTEIYICSKLSTNLKMGSIGCKYLSRTPLPCIQILTLSILLYKIGGNHMESSGICHLSKTAWNTLTKISLSKAYLMKLISQLGLSAYTCSPERTGRVSQKSIYVFIPRNRRRLYFR